MTRSDGGPDALRDHLDSRLDPAARAWFHQALAEAAAPRRPGADLRLGAAPRRGRSPLRQAATALARKKLGSRYRMAVVSLDPAPVRGSHGRLPTSDDDGPLLLCSTPRAVGDRIAATDVKSLLLRLAGLGTDNPSEGRHP